MTELIEHEQGLFDPGTMRSIALLCIWLVQLILAAGLLSPNATLNSTWSTRDGILLYQAASFTPGFGCGFARLKNCKGCVGNKIFFFSVYILGYASEAVGESGTGDDARLAQIIWSANRNTPVSINSTLQLGQDGNLVLRDADGAVVWESNTTGLGVVGIELQPSANLVLFDSNKNVLWESFSSPTDTLFMGQPLKVGSKLVSTISDSNMSEGHFYLEVEHDKVSLKVLGQVYAKWCAYEGVSFIQLNNGTLNCYNSSTVMSSITITQVTSRGQFLRILPDGNLKLFIAEGNPSGDDRNSLELIDSFRNFMSPCGSYPGACGVYGICTPTQQCSCIQPHFSFIDQADPPQGCLLDAPPVCSNQSHANEFIELQGMDYGPAQFLSSTYSSGSLPFQIDKCKSSCLNNCSCKALVYYPDQKQCFQFTEMYTLWNATLDDGSMPTTFIKTASQFSKPISNSPVSTRTPIATFPVSMKAHRRKWLPASITIVTIMPMLLLTMMAFRRRKVLKKHCTQDQSEIFVPSIPNLPKLFKYQELCLITDNFDKELGTGGFGTVFEGILSDGTKVAVKCLESARQGLKQFEAEVMTIGSIHHKNLVKLLGFGVEKSQYYLIYEFVANLSLDKWLFNEGSHTLDWQKRFDIAMDIARGLHYLHEGCQERVLHLDIKPQNILLDSSFQAKICDFGLAKFIDKGKSYIDTAVMGTPGYMAPDWLHARVTEKTDVYSFGIVLLEIVSGRKTAPLPTGLSSQNTVRIKAFEQEENLVEHVDFRLLHDVGKLDMEQVRRITRIGLQCVQEDPSQRPSMREVVKMLDAPPEHKSNHSM